MELKNLFPLAAFQKTNPAATRHEVNKMVKRKQLDRWVAQELLATHTAADAYREQWGNPRPGKTYVYDWEALAAAFTKKGEYRSGITIQKRQRRKINEAMAAATRMERLPVGKAPAIAALDLPLLSRNMRVDIGAIEVVDAIGAAFQGRFGTLKYPSWTQTVNRMVGLAAVALCPAMATRSFEDYLRYVGSKDYDLLTLVTALGFDDVDDFAESLFWAIDLEKNIHAPINLDSLLKTIGDPCPGNPYELACLELRALLAESIAKREFFMPEKDDLQIAECIRWLLMSGQIAEPEKLTAFTLTMKYLPYTGMYADMSGQFKVRDIAAAKTTIVKMQAAIAEAEHSVAVAARIKAKKDELARG